MRAPAAEIVGGRSNGVLPKIIYIPSNTNGRTPDEQIVNVNVVPLPFGRRDIVVIPISYGVVSDVKPLKTSDMRDTIAAKVEFQDTPSKKLKYSRRSQTIANEIQGTAILNDSPFSDRIAQQEYASPQEGVMFSEWIDGTIFSDSIQAGHIRPDTALKVYKDLRGIQKMWWEQQEKRFPESGQSFDKSEYVSFQRDEWNTVLVNLPTAMLTVAKRFGIKPQDLWENQLEINGRILPPLRRIVGTVDALYRNNPPYLVKANVDAKRINIVIKDQNTGEWKIMDGEFVGLADPSEADAIESKYETSSMVEIIGNPSMNYVSDHILRVNLQAKFPQACTDIQQNATSQGEMQELVALLDDPSYPDRFYTYLAGSYLKEFAINQRNNPELALLALVKTAESIANSQSEGVDYGNEIITLFNLNQEQVALYEPSWLAAYEQVAQYYELPFDRTSEGLSKLPYLLEKMSFQKAQESGLPKALLILSGTQAVGKGELGKKLLEEGLLTVPNYTTRLPRPDEVQGVDKIFVTEEELRNMWDAGELLTVAEQNHSPHEEPYMAGFGKQIFLDILGKAGSVFIEKTPDGWRRVVENLHLPEEQREALEGNSRLIYILPPDLETLALRATKRPLRNFGIPLDQLQHQHYDTILTEIERSLGKADMTLDTLGMNNITYIVNDNVERVLARLNELITIY